MRITTQMRYARTKQRRIRAGLALAAALCVFGAAPSLASAAITFDGSPGTNAPPSTLGPYTMTAFPDDPRPTLTDFTTVPGPTGDVTFDIPMEHREVPPTWTTWSHGYTGDVYFTKTAGQVTMTLPASTCAFYFYAEPDIGTHNVTATAQDGTTSGPVSINFNSDARYFGFYGTGGQALSSITVTSDAVFAVGEFGIASGSCGASSGPPMPGPAQPVPPQPPQAPVARDTTAPVVRVAGVRSGCVSRNFRLRVRVNENAISLATVSVDRRRVGKSRGAAFSVVIPARRLRVGAHRLRIAVVDEAGNRRTVRRRFVRCAAARRPARRQPRFTG